MIFGFCEKKVKKKKKKKKRGIGLIS